MFIYGPWYSNFVRMLEQRTYVVLAGPDTNISAKKTPSDAKGTAPDRTKRADDSAVQRLGTEKCTSVLLATPISDSARELTCAKSTLLERTWCITPISRESPMDDPLQNLRCE